MHVTFFFQFAIPKQRRRKKEKKKRKKKTSHGRKDDTQSKQPIEFLCRNKRQTDMHA